MSFNLCTCISVMNRKRKKDRRHITHYRSYHYAKYLGLIGSLIICLGLGLWFMVRPEATEAKLIATITVTAIGLIVFFIATFLFFKSAYHTFMEQRNENVTTTTTATTSTTSATATTMAPQSLSSSKFPLSNTQY
ncbi:hypothetical protein DERF_012565 [Dermatophagoides farinae]|uniref:Uncharacterized protein n=1 Tax=Dermatophagoides farinae TaxID=6954 RepID=A0A922HTQ2_DERFA|nr:uncharacterized protein LOC124496729 [Dermatophagoides farinae]KAH7637738.1 hypothetical protein HUG17_8842 [Dermatophagoides farinae]KAH9501742.1 hypothetical protein DERF_012565 [Dermatophagoides farinae]